MPGEGTRGGDMRVFELIEYVAVVAGFRMRHDEAIHAVRGRRPKAPRHEIAGSGAPRCAGAYGDLAAVR